MGKNRGPKWYAVRKGHQVGIFTVWDGRGFLVGAKEATEGFTGNCFQSFDNPQDAEKFMNNEIICGHKHCAAERMKHGSLTPSVKTDPVVDLTKASCCTTSDAPSILQEKRQPKIELPKDVVDSETPFPSFYCHGIKVLFPQGKQPYSVQKKMMFKLLQALKGVKPTSARATLNACPGAAATKVFNLKPPDRDGLIPGNCLLESPTGTGKTIALLSAALSWLQHEKGQIKIQYEKEVAEFKSRNNPEISVLDSEEVAVKLEEVSKMNMELNKIKSKSMSPKSLPYSPVIQRSPLKPHSVQNSPLLLPTGFPYDDDVLTHDDSNEFCDGSVMSTSKEQFQPAINPNTLPLPVPPGNLAAKSKPPKIFYGTRTHKQIKQIVSELKKIPYAKDIKMTVLSSRQRTCLKDDPDDPKRSKNSICQELLAPHGKGCGFLVKLKTKMEDRAEKVREEIRKNEKVDSVVFDIEDLHLVGKEKGFCPYFAGTRTLMQDAELIFCPYNYLIDDIVREKMDIDLTGHVVILDEGHNVEDNCMEAASCTLESMECDDAADAFKNYHEYRPPKVRDPGSGEWVDPPLSVELIIKKAAALRMLNRCNTIADWLQKNCTKNLIKTRYSKDQYKTEKNPEVIHRHLERDLGFDDKIGRDALQTDFSTLCERSEEAQESDSDGDGQTMHPPLQQSALQFMEQIIHLLKFFYSTPDAKENYRLCFKKKEPPKQTQMVGAEMVCVDADLSAAFWCMNPALAFKDAFGTCRSVIIASGTLSPMNTFASELGTDFLHKLEGEHVVPKDNYRIFALPKGPKGHVLKCTYDNTKEPGFKDDLGRLVLSVCESVPDGVLCFVSSYSLLFDLEETWKQEGILEQISKYKEIFFEPRGSSDKTDDVATKYFRMLYDLKKDSAGDGVNGALFLAVMRGKVSEGLDFNDEYARAVITVGIPYPSLGDPKVELKREFNDKRRKTSPLVLTGKAWYETQAFRALNQSLGRCLRYKDDWGSIIMVDQRFMDPYSQSKYRGGVSKWMRTDITPVNHLQEFTKELQHFSRTMQAKTQKENNGARVVSTKPPKSAEEILVPNPSFLAMFGSPMVVGSGAYGTTPICEARCARGPQAKRRKIDVIKLDEDLFE